ncbi:MBL fold metallo-hydrolase [Frankia sp. ArI3]|uniref:MBL fold metallo-hydrolase n=1 Tax=Frankia sp. ArI3 TaxID=1858 RepID=UPI001C6FCDCA|nr:MBL fold metallo-hydrolase [Frankia sp. ArI3]
MKVGDLNVQPVWDGDARVRARDVLTPPGGDEAHWECNAEHFTAAGEFEMALGGFLIRTGDQVVLVDAGLGPLSARGFHGGHLLDSLTALGVRPADVTDVLLTHLHGDHTGWTALEDRPVFPNATYRCHAADWHHFVDGPQPDRRTAAKLAPITGQVELFDTDLTLAPGIDARHTPGHTPRLDDLRRLQRPAPRPAARRRRPLPPRTPRRRLGDRLRHRQPRRPGRPRPPHRRDRVRRHPRRLPALRRPALRPRPRRHHQPPLALPRPLTIFDSRRPRPTDADRGGAAGFDSGSPLMVP